jgi:hypothetical protein
MGWSDGVLEYWSDACGMINRKEPSAAKPQPKKKQDIHHEVIHELTLAHRG